MLIGPPGRCRPEGYFHAVPPEALARLSAWLVRRGYEVEAIDSLIEGYQERLAEGQTVRYGLTEKRVAALIREYEPDVVGINCTFTNIEADVLGLARESKACLPDVPVVIGGSHAALNAGDILNNNPCVDFVCLSEGETSLVSLLECLNQGGDASSVPGMASRIEGKAHATPLTEFLNLDELPLPDWSFCPIDSYPFANLPHENIGRKRRYLTTQWSRGCINACSFCLTPRVWGAGNYRRRSVAHVISEAEQLLRIYNIEELHLEDDCLTADMDWFRQALDDFARHLPGLSLEFPNGIDVNRIDHDLAVRLGKVRTVRLALSFGAGPSEGDHRLVGKSVDPAHGRTSVRLLQDQGIRVSGFIQIGFPGQTVSDMRKTVDYAISLGLDDINLYIATPFPGTALHALCKKNGWLVEPLDYREFRLSKGLIRTDQFGPEDTERIRREGWEEFHRLRRSG